MAEHRSQDAGYELVMPDNSYLLLSEAIRLGIPSDRAHKFLAASLSNVRSPWDIPGMETLVARLDAAAKQDKRLLLLGDFDTDGTTATAVLFATLARRMPSARRYNPWFREGYGLQVAQVERFAAEGIEVIITIDNGITAHAAVERAVELGVETLIIDHHLPRSDIGAPHTTYLDPPDNVLSASQVGYLVAQALRETWWGEAGHDDEGLALAAVGAQMDWMPLNVAENRGWIAHAQRIVNSPRARRGLPRFGARWAKSTHPANCSASVRRSTWESGSRALTPISSSSCFCRTRRRRAETNSPRISCPSADAWSNWSAVCTSV